MSAGRGRRVQFDIVAPAEPAALPSIGPLVFSVRCDGKDYPFDLSDLPCPRLVRHLAAALIGIAGENGSQRAVKSVQHSVGYIRAFATFIGAVESHAARDFDLEDLTPDLLEAFEQALVTRSGGDSYHRYTATVGVVQLLRLVHEHAPDVFDVEMQARLGFSALRARPILTPLDSYPAAVFDAMQAAALLDVRAVRDRILDSERRAQAGRDPQVGGWDRLENVLWHIARHGPLESADKAPSPVRRRLYALGGTRSLNSRLFLSTHDLVPFLVLLGCQTGLEPECLRRLRADCLVNPARGFVSIDYVKPRARGSSHKTIRVADGGGLHHPGGVVRLALRLTQRGRLLAGTDQLWTDVDDRGARASFGARRGLDRASAAWVRRHGLHTMLDRGNVPVSLHAQRLRKTAKSQQYLRAAGVLEDFAAGHTKQVAAGHYADIEAHRQLHEDAVEDGLRQALGVALAPPVVLDEDGHRLDDGAGQLQPPEVRDALSGSSDVWLASCRDFYASPFSLKKGSGCPVAVWGCLECPNAVFTTRHLPSILSFLAFTEQQRDELPRPEWTARYGLAVDRIVSGIRPKFTTEQLVTAHAIAEAGGPALSLPARFLELTT